MASLTISFKEGRKADPDHATKMEKVAQAAVAAAAKAGLAVEAVHSTAHPGGKVKVKGA